MFIEFVIEKNQLYCENRALLLKFNTIIKSVINSFGEDFMLFVKSLKNKSYSSTKQNYFKETILTQVKFT